MQLNNRDMRLFLQLPVFWDSLPFLFSTQPGPPVHSCPCCPTPLPGIPGGCWGSTGLFSSGSPWGPLFLFCYELSLHSSGEPVEARYLLPLPGAGAARHECIDLPGFRRPCPTSECCSISPPGPSQVAETPPHVPSTRPDSKVSSSQAQLAGFRGEGVLRTEAASQPSASPGVGLPPPWTKCPGKAWGLSKPCRTLAGPHYGPPASVIERKVQGAMGTGA